MATVYATPAAPQMVIQTQELTRNTVSFGFMVLAMLVGILSSLGSLISLLMFGISMGGSFMTLTGFGGLMGIASAVTYGKAAFDKEWLLTGSVPLKLSPLLIFPAIYATLFINCFGFLPFIFGIVIGPGFWWALFSFHKPARPYKYKTVTRVAY